MLLSAEPTAIETIMRLAMREAALQGAALYWDGFDALMPDERQFSRAALLRELETRTGITFLAGDAIWEPVDALQDLPFVRIEIPSDSRGTQSTLENISQRPHAPRARHDLGSFANKFRFSGGQIRDAAATARNLALWRDPESGQVSMSIFTTPAGYSPTASWPRWLRKSFRIMAGTTSSCRMTKCASSTKLPIT